MPTEKMVTRKDYDQLREELHRARLALNEYARENSYLKTQIALIALSVDRSSITAGEVISISEGDVIAIGDGDVTNA